MTVQRNPLSVEQLVHLLRLFSLMLQHPGTTQSRHAAHVEVVSGAMTAQLFRSAVHWFQARLPKKCACVWQVASAYLPQRPCGLRQRVLVHLPPYIYHDNLRAGTLPPEIIRTVMETPFS